MKKLSVIAIADHREETLHQLQELGLLHVRPVEKPATATAADAAERVRTAQRALALVETAAHEHAATPPAHEDAAGDGATLVDRVLAMEAERAALKEKHTQLTQRLADLAVWGEFDPRRVGDLAAAGITVKLYVCTPQQMPEPPDGCAFEEVERTGHRVAFVAMSREPFTLPIPEIALPDAPPSALAAQAEDAAGAIARLTGGLAALNARAAAIRAHITQLENDAARARARDALAGVGTLVCLQGFCPVEAVPALERAAAAHGWGVLVEDPAPGDDVPTLIRNPRWLRPIEVVFNFIDTFPGYTEKDISGVFYLFMSIFYAMLIGDAGYGMLYLAILLAIHVKLGRRAPTQVFTLLYVFNVTCIIWGALTGSYFGIKLPATSFLNNLIVLNPADTPMMMKLCFVIAAVHMTIAHGWNAVQMMNSWRGAAEASWILVLWGAYFLANTLLLGKPFPPVMYWVSGGGIVLALVFSGTLVRPLELLQFPFKVINFFGDTVSYLRLFAVGMASAAIAQAFNALAAGVDLPLALRIPLVLVLLVGGHALNMVLGPLSVLVHGLRLNVLEFSSHLGQEWTGVKYDPLRRR
ncbi:hypothetical protein GX586_14050 [bacterium]|nr:hypothetical protein [bacterium]